MRANAAAHAGREQAGDEQHRGRVNGDGGPARVSGEEPGAASASADAPLAHKRTSVGTSIRPAPCAEAIRNDHSARPALAPACRCGAAARCRARRATMLQRRAARQPGPASTRGRSRALATTAHASTLIDATCPKAIGRSARRACASSRACTPQAAASIQPLAGLSPWSAPAPAIASHDHSSAMAGSLASRARPHAFAAQHEATAGAAVAGCGA